MAQRYVGIFNFEQKLEEEQETGFTKLAEITIIIARIGNFPGYTVMNKQFYIFFQEILSYFRKMQFFRSWLFTLFEVRVF